LTIVSFLVGFFKEATFRLPIQNAVATIDFKCSGKLPHLIELKYHLIGDALAELGSVSEIRDVFIGFQQHLYAPISPD
jgi:hypothetical protein